MTQADLQRDPMAVLRDITQMPGVLDVLKETIVGYLLKRYSEEIEMDPTIENPEAILEIISLGAGYLDDLVRLAEAGETQG